MARLRLDGSFADHPKVVGLPDRAFRVHVEAMLYCAAHSTGGSIAAPIALRLYRSTPKVVATLVAHGLWETDGDTGDSYAIHDWTVAARPRRGPGV